VAEDVPSILRRAIHRADGVWLLPDRTVVSRDSFRFTLRLAAERRVPLMVFSESMVRAGGLVGLVPDPAEVGRQAADLVVRLLDREAPGAPPAVEEPRTLRLVLNARTASNLGVPIPQELVSRQDTHVYR
jgi:putative ABC transport system substrate-binding protein